MKSIKLKSLISESNRIHYDNQGGFMFVDEVAFTREDIDELGQLLNSTRKTFNPSKRQFDWSFEISINDKIQNSKVKISESDISELVKHSKKHKITSRKDL